MSRDLVLGLDGGGSKTVVALADRDGTVTGRDSIRSATRNGAGTSPGWCRRSGWAVAILVVPF